MIQTRLTMEARIMGIQAAGATDSGTDERERLLTTLYHRFSVFVSTFEIPMASFSDRVNLRAISARTRFSLESFFVKASRYPHRRKYVHNSKFEQILFSYLRKLLHFISK